MKNQSIIKSVLAVIFRERIARIQQTQSARRDAMQLMLDAVRYARLDGLAAEEINTRLRRSLRQYKAGEYGKSIATTTTIL